jgi:hypothetical protein
VSAPDGGQVPVYGGMVTYALQASLDAAGGTLGVPVVAVPDPDPGES